MNIATVIWWFGIGLLVLAIAMLGPLAASLSLGEKEFFSSYGLSAVLCIFLGTGLLFIVQNRQESLETKAGMREIVIVLLVWWTMIPLFAGLPFLLQGHTVADAWYEAVSALTTTGAWISFETATGSAAGMIWRAELQWLGGLISMAAAASVFIRPEFVGIDTVIPPFARGENASYLQAFKSALLAFFPAFAIIALAAGILFSIVGVPVLDAFVMALSLTASGGFAPSANGIASYGPFASNVAVIVMTLSAINFVTIVRWLRLQAKRAGRGTDRETPTFLILTILVSLVFLLSIAGFDFAAWPAQLFNAVSILSTNGLIIGEQPALIPALVTAIIGGAAISTAGGLKLLRWLVTFGRARQEIWKLIHPQGISGRGSAANELGVWIHYISFTLILSLLVLTITIFGNSLELAVTTAVAVISNAGPLIVLSPGEISQYDVFHPALRVILAIGMIIGRLEMVVALALFNRFFWRS